MNNIKRFIKNRKAISPIFATLILIAIAVIAGVVVYMFTSGTLSTMTGGGTAAQEKVAVQGVSYAHAATSITVYAQNMGTGSVSPMVNGLIVKDSQGNTVASATTTSTTPAAFTSVALPAGTLTTLTGNIAALTSGNTYTVTVTTAAGGSFVSSSFVAPSA